MTALPLTDIGPLRPIMSRRPLGIFSHNVAIHSPIVERPEDAAVTPRSRSLLKRLIRVGVRVALITGRSLATAQAMVRLDKAVYAANHGLEYWLDGRVELTEGVERYAALVERIVS